MTNKATFSFKPPTSKPKSEPREVVNSFLPKDKSGLEPLSNFEAEFDLCSWLITHSNDAPDEAMRLLDKVMDKDFAQPIFRNILTCIRHAVTNSQSLSPTVIIEIAKQKKVEVIPENLGPIVSDPIASQFSFEQIESSAQIILDHSTRRRIRSILQGHIAELEEKSVTDSVEAIIDDSIVLESSLKNVRHEPEHISVAMGEIIEELSGVKTDSLPTPTGFIDMDNALNGGIRDTEMIVVAGRPGMGKTTWAMGVARNIAMTPGAKPVLFFSAEMKATQQASRLLSAESGVAARLLRRGELDNESFNAVASVLDRFASPDDEGNVHTKLWIDDRPGISLSEIRSTARQFRRKTGVSPIVMVDYIQIVNSSDRLQGRGDDGGARAVANISQGLKNLARELDTPVVALSQLNRALEQRACKRPIMSDLRESGSIEQDADIIIFLYRDCVYNENADPYDAEAIIAKQREGQVGVIKLGFNGEVVRFESLGTSSY